MTRYTPFTLPSGATVYVQSSQASPAGGTGTAQASAAEERLRESWTHGSALVAEIGGTVIDSLRHAFRGVEEATVEFGVNISGKTGIILVEGTAAANLKVVVKWKPPKQA
jgi:hypothetical protein